MRGQYFEMQNNLNIGRKGRNFRLREIRSLIVKIRREITGIILFENTKKITYPIIGLTTQRASIANRTKHILVRPLV